MVHLASCANNVYVKQLDPEQSTGAIKVRATVRAQMTVCGNCGAFDSAHMNVIMAVRNIQVVARRPQLVAEPGHTVTRGDTVTFRVINLPNSGTTFSNWRYEPTGHPAIVRSQNINTPTWTGPLLLGGKAKVVVIVPGQSVSIPLETTPAMTVNPRAWNSLPLAPQKLTGLAPPPGIFSAATNPSGPMGWWNGYLSGVHTSVKLDGDTPNKGLSYVTEVKYDNDPAAFFGYEISPDVEPGTTFYSKQCGQGGFILGSVLRSNTYEHESGTQKGHYQQYRDKLAEPAVNYAKYAENRIGPVSWTKQQFDDDLQDAFNERRQTLYTAAGVQACNANVRYDHTCPAPGSFRGEIAYPPYQAPCQ